MRASPRTGRIVLACLIACVVFFAGRHAARAQLCAAFGPGGGSCFGAAAVFLVDVNAVRLQKADGTVIEIAANPQTFDIAAVGAMQLVATYATDVIVPPGTYTTGIAVLDPTLMLRGSVALADGTGRTCRTCNGPCTPSDGGAAETVPIDLTLIPGLTVDANGDILATIPIGQMTVADGSIVSIDIAFDVGNAVTFEFTGAGPAFLCQSASLGSLLVQFKGTVE